MEYLRYWVNEPEGKVLCLVEAPSTDAANAGHREAHGLVAESIFPVEEGADAPTHPQEHRRPGTDRAFGAAAFVYIGRLRRRGT